MLYYAIVLHHIYAATKCASSEEYLYSDAVSRVVENREQVQSSAGIEQFILNTVTVSHTSA